MKNQITLFLLFISIVLYAQNTPGEYTVENVKTNTRSSDFGTAFFGKGKVVFAAPKKGISTMDNSVWDNNNNQPYLDLFVGEINENGEIINKQKMPGDINSKYNEGVVSFTKDKKTVYFSANNYIKKKYRTDSSGTNNIQIFKATINKNGDWSNLKMLPFNSNYFSTGHPALNIDDTKLYFVSDRPGSMGKTDIFVVDVYEDGTYSEPRNLGSKINTSEREMFPFISDDNILYFSSNGHPGKGELDVFASKIFDNTVSEPINLETPVNSNKDDFSYIIDDSKDKGYFSSNRDGGKGDDDIYSFTVSPPIYIECQQAISGVVKDINTNEILPGVLIELFDEQGNELNSFISKLNDASFSFEQPCNGTYKLIGSLEGYLPKIIEIKTLNDLDLAPLEISMNLTPASSIIAAANNDSNKFISGVVKDTYNQKLLPGATVVLLDENGNVLQSVVASKEDASFSFDHAYDDSYTIVVSSNGYADKEIELNSLNDLGLSPIEVAMNHSEDGSIIAGANKNSGNSISGVVKDINNQKLLPGAKVNLLDENGNVIETVVASSDGSFSFDHPYKEDYKVVVSSKGYANKEIELNSLNDLGINPIDVAMNQSDNDSMLADANNDSNKFISGVVKDTNNQKLLPGATVVLLDENGTILQSVTANKDDASFSFDHAYNEAYTIVVSSNGYADKEIELNSLNDLGDKTIEVAMNLSSDTSMIANTNKNFGNSISGVVKDTNNQKLLPGATVVLLDENGTILQSVTANKDDASFRFDHLYYEDYKVVVSSKGYADKEIELSSLNDLNDKTIDVAMNLSSDDSIIASGSNSIKINTIYFNFDKFNIRPDAKHELDRIVNIMNEYPDMKMNVGSHTDSRGKNSYNIKLSNKRANSTIQYLLNKGISFDRISGNGFGEEQLAENCFDEKSCTEFQHQLNRRSQFNFTNTPENITIKTYNRLLSDGYKSKVSVANSGVYINYNFDSNNTTITYTVQIGAFKNNVQSNKFDKMTNLFNHHYNDGYNRYFAGKFKTSDEARSYAILLKESGFDGAFLVGLKGDTRF